MRSRLIAGFVGIVAVVLLVQDVPLVFHLERVERDRLETGLERDAYVLAGQSEEVLEGDGDQVGALEDAAAAYHARTGAHVVITDDDAVTVVSSGDGESTGADRADQPEVRAARWALRGWRAPLPRPRRGHDLRGCAGPLGR